MSDALVALLEGIVKVQNEIIDRLLELERKLEDLKEKSDKKGQVMIKCYVCQEGIPDGECCVSVGSGEHLISRHASCLLNYKYECIDCGHSDILENFHKRDHGGWDCPKCYGEIK